MQRYQRILVCIEDLDIGSRMLEYIGPICKAAETKQVHLLNVMPTETTPVGFEEAEPITSTSLTKKDLQELGQQRLNGHGGEEIITNVVQGSALVEILRYALNQDIDLIVMGRPSEKTKIKLHKGVLATRITRKATCSVLVLPEETTFKMKKILVPVRDSECSANAVDTACAFAAPGGATVCCLNVFHVSSGYLRVGTTLEEHTALLEKWAQRDCENLLNRVDTCNAKITIRCIPDFYAKPVPIILEEIKKESADLVAIGARGRTGTAGVLLGTVTEHLMNNSPVPVLAVKKKGECIGIVKAILSLT
jgi:nucleotide-binding universal stress UspA family protein